MEINISPKGMKELLDNSIVDFTKPFNPSDYTFNNDVSVTEDQAIGYGVSILSLIEDKEKQGFREIHRYQHPAVGLVVVMRQDYSLAE
jgi:hypothetical protein